MTVKEPLLYYQKQIKMKKHNIGIEDQPKMETIGDYWDEEMVRLVIDILKEYEDIFQIIFY